MIEILALALLCMFAAAYGVVVLLFTSDADGPFKAEDCFVIDESLDCGQVTVFDRVRRLFGAYRVERKTGVTIWTVFEPRMEVWRCPKCLGFWLSSLVSIPYSVWLVHDLGDLRTLLLVPIIQATFSFIVSFLSFIYLRVTG